MKRGGLIRWLGLAAAAWAVALGVTAYVSSRSGTPTAPEQITLAKARASVDGALARVAAVAGPDTVASLAAYSLRPGCRVTTVRKGTDLSREIRLYTAAGTERALLDRLAAALPADFRARIPRPIGSAAPALRAEAADFVVLRGQQAGPGEVRVEAEAGCRTGSDLGVPALGPAPTPAEHGQLAAVLRALGAREPRWYAYQAPCPGGGVVRTVEAESATDGSPAPLPVVAKAAGEGTVPILDQPQAYAFKHRATAVAVRIRENAVTVTVTTTSSC